MKYKVIIVLLFSACIEASQGNPAQAQAQSETSLSSAGVSQLQDCAFLAPHIAQKELQQIILGYLMCWKKTQKIPNMYIQSVTFSPDSKRLVSTSTEDGITFWENRVSDDAANDWVMFLRQEKLRLYGSMAFVANDYLVGYDKVGIHFWRYQKSRSEWTITQSAKQENISTISVAAHAQYVASREQRDNAVTLWQKQGKEQWQVVQRLRGHIKQVNTIAFSPDEKYIASGSEDETVIVWLRSDSAYYLFQELTGHKDYICSVMFSPDGKYLASASKNIKLWQLDQNGEWQETQTLDGHSKIIVSIAFSSDSQYLVSGSNDKTIKIWKLFDNKWKEIQTLTGPTAAITSVVFSPDGKYLAAASDDHHIHIFKKSLDLLTAAESAAINVAQELDLSAITDTTQDSS